MSYRPSPNSDHLFITTTILRLHIGLLLHKLPLNNDHLSTTLYSFRVPRVVVIHRFDCSFFYRIGSQKSGINKEKKDCITILIWKKKWIRMNLLQQSYEKKDEVILILLSKIGLRVLWESLLFCQRTLLFDKNLSLWQLDCQSICWINRFSNQKDWENVLIWLKCIFSFLILLHSKSLPVFVSFLVI